MKLSASQILALGAVGLAGAVLYFGKREIEDFAGAFNPTDPKNVINRGFNRTLEAVGVLSKGESFGSWLYDVFHTEYDPNRESREAGIDGA